MYPVDAVEWFERRHAGLLGAAKRFSRLGPRPGGRDHPRRGGRAESGCSLHGGAAARGTARTGVEAVRQVLRRHDERTRKKGARSSAPALAGERDRRVFWRAWRAGSRRDGGAAGCRGRGRAIGVERAARLRALPLGAWRRPGGGGLLDVPQAAAGLRAGGDGLASFLADARVRRVPVASAEMARRGRTVPRSPWPPRRSPRSIRSSRPRRGWTLRKRCCGRAALWAPVGADAPGPDGADAGGRWGGRSNRSARRCCWTCWARRWRRWRGRRALRSVPGVAAGAPGGRWGWQPTGRRRRGSGARAADHARAFAPGRDDRRPGHADPGLDPLAPSLAGVPGAGGVRACGRGPAARAGADGAEAAAGLVRPAADAGSGRGDHRAWRRESGAGRGERDPRGVGPGAFRVGLSGARDTMVVWRDRVRRVDRRPGVHVELATQGKMFAAPQPGHAGSPGPPQLAHRPHRARAARGAAGDERAAVEMAMLVGWPWLLGGAALPLGPQPTSTRHAQRATRSYDLPLCFDGRWTSRRATRVVIDPEEPVAADRDRPRLEEDAGKLLHGAWRRSDRGLDRGPQPRPHPAAGDRHATGLPLQRHVGDVLALREHLPLPGRERGRDAEGADAVRAEHQHRVAARGRRAGGTPVVEIKNLNSFRRAQGAIDHEHAEQPGRWHADGRVMGKGMKTTRGWDDARRDPSCSAKEDAQDYRYFPDPDLPPVAVDAACASGCGRTPGTPRWRG